MKCRNCGCELSDDNWTISRQEKNDFLCYNCSSDAWKNQDVIKRQRHKLSAALADHRRRGHEVIGKLSDYEHIITHSCPYCGLEFDPLSVNKFNTGSFDVINPFEPVTPDNVQWICLSCNMAKGKRSDVEFRDYIRRLTQFIKEE